MVTCCCYCSDELLKLKGTGVVETVERDLKSIEKEFNTVVLPFVLKHPSIFPFVICSDCVFFVSCVKGSMVVVILTFL